MNEKLKKTITDYWEKNGVDITKPFFSLFGLDAGLDGRYVRNSKDFYDLVIEFYGGIEKILKKLNNLVGKTFTIIDGGYNFDIKIEKFYVLDGRISCDVVADGQGEVYLFNLDETMSISQAVNDKEFGWEIKHEMTDSVRDWLFEKVTKKTGIIVLVEGLKVYYEI